MKPDELLNILDQEQLVSRNVVRQLRAKLSQNGGRVTAESVLKFLVKKELITRGDALRLLQTRLKTSEKAESSIMGNAVLPPRETDAPSTARARRKDETLGLAPIEEDDPQRTRQPRGEEVEVAPVVPPPAEHAEADASLSAPTAASQPPVDHLAEAAARTGDYGGPVAARTKARPTNRKKRSRGQSEWDSPLILYGGGGLAVLAIAGVLLYYLLFRENADQRLAAAADLFAAGSYGQAIVVYEEVVEKFPNHPDASHARVRLEMARLFQAVGGASATEALETAKSVIAAVENEPAFSDSDEEEENSEARRELSELLTTIAERLAQDAEKSVDADTAQAAIEGSRQAIEMIGTYFTEQQRSDVQISEVRKTLGLVEKRLERDQALATTIAGMDEAIANQNSAAAYALRKELLLIYPNLESNEQLAAKIREVSLSEQEKIRFTATNRPAIRQQREEDVVSSVSFATQSGNAVPGVEGQLAVRIDGVLYGFAASDGALLWRRFVGATPHAYPLLSPDGQCFVSDVESGDLVCLDASSGEFLWRQELDDETYEPSFLANRVLVPSASGKLYSFDRSSGELLGHCDFGQPIRLAAVLSSGGRRIFVVGDHSNIYTLDADDLSCVGVFYLGHEAGAVQTPPLAMQRTLIVAENAGTETSRIIAIALDDDHLPTSIVATNRLDGLVNTPLMTHGRRVAAVSTLGAVSVYELGSPDEGQALNLISSREARGAQHSAHFGLLSTDSRESNVWIAGDRLAKLAILPTGGRMPRRTLAQDYLGSTFDYPLQRIDNLIVHVRRRKSQPGLAIAANDLNTGKQFWETTFADPAAGIPGASATSGPAVHWTMSGTRHTIESFPTSGRRVSNLQSHDLPTAHSTEAPLSQWIHLGEGNYVIGLLGAPLLRFVRLSEGDSTVSEVRLPGPLACLLTPWRDGVIAATVVGQVVFYNQESVAAVAFQPPLSPGERIRWLQPTTTGNSARSSILVSDRKTVYSLRLADGVRPYLSESTRISIPDAKLTTSLAVVGDLVLAGANNGRLMRFRLPDLAPEAAVDLGDNSVVWGPFPAGSGVILATNEELMLVEAAGEIRWRQAHASERPLSDPLIDGETAIVVFPRSGVTNVSLTDGSMKRRTALREPAVLGPARYGNSLLVSALDGTLLKIDRP